MPERLEAALDVIYLVSNEGYAATSGDAHIRRSLCAEALRLAAIIAELMPDEPEALGLLALLLAHDARQAARVDETGALVLLPDQDRTLWDRATIARATGLAARALRLGSPGRYVLQAAIAVEHINAPRADATRWDRIAAYYERLAPALDRYHYFHAARADLLRRLDAGEAASEAYERALQLAGNNAERAFLERRLTETHD